jgi:hypothetical protein
MKSLQELCEMEDKDLRVMCARYAGHVLKWSDEQHVVAGRRGADLVSPTGEFVLQFWWPKDSLEEAWIKTWSYLPKYTTDLNACVEFESILLSQVHPAKMYPGEKATPLQRFEYAMTALEPDRPLWAKSPRAKTISFIYSQQTN